MKKEAGRISVKLNLYRFPPVFVAEITNQTGREVKIWEDSCSYGYEAPMLQLHDHNSGLHYVVTRKPIDWTVNIAAYHRIAVGETLKLTFDLSDSSWVLPPGLDLNNRAMAARIIFVFREREFSGDVSGFSPELAAALRSHARRTAAKHRSVYSGALASEWCTIPEPRSTANP